MPEKREKKRWCSRIEVFFFDPKLETENNAFGSAILKTCFWQGLFVLSIFG